MTEKELLEAAAKAYWGDEIDDVCSIRWLEADQAIGYTHADNQDHNGQDVELLWDPLIYDDDAFRLAAKLKIDIHYEYNGTVLGDIVEAMSPEREDGSRLCIAESTTKDGADATRRAVVSVAVAMLATPQ
jgi:hypothetical protein